MDPAQAAAAQMGEVFADQMAEQKRYDDTFRAQQEEQSEKIRQQTEAFMEAYRNKTSGPKSPAISPELQQIVQWCQQNPIAVPAVLRYCEQLHAKLSAAIAAALGDGEPTP